MKPTHNLMCESASFIYTLFILLGLQQIANFSKQFLLCRTSGFWSGLLFLFLRELVHSLDHQEDTQCDDEEIDDVLNERTIGEHRCASLLSCLQRRVGLVIGQVDKEVREIHTACTLADDGHKHIVNE